MQKINFNFPLLFFLSIYFIIAFFPLQFYIAPESTIPLGQLIILSLIAFFSPLARNLKFSKSHNTDFKIIKYLFFYVTLNATFQEIFSSNEFVLQRTFSLLGTLIPIFIFFIILSIDISEKYLVRIFRYFFIGCFIYSCYYFEYYVSNLVNNIEQNRVSDRVIGQRDFNSLNFALLLALFWDYKKNHFDKIMGVLIILFCSTLMILSHTRLGYVLLIVDLILIFYFSKKIFVFLVAISLIGLIALYFIDPLLFNEKIMYSVKRVYTMIDFFQGSSNYDSSFDFRISIWGFILEYISSSPFNFLFGSGEVGVHSLNASFPYIDYFGNYSEYRVTSAESGYLDTLFRRGLIGIIFLLTILIRLIYILIKLADIDRQFKNLYISLIIGFVGVLIAFIFLPLFRDRNFVLFFFVFYALLSSRFYRTLGK